MGQGRRQVTTNAIKVVAGALNDCFGPVQTSSAEVQARQPEFAEISDLSARHYAILVKVCLQEV